MARSPFEPFLLENGFVILDGGLATELESQVNLVVRLARSHAVRQHETIT